MIEGTQKGLSALMQDAGDLDELIKSAESTRHYSRHPQRLARARAFRSFKKVLFVEFLTLIARASLAYMFIIAIALAVQAEWRSEIVVCATLSILLLVVLRPTVRSFKRLKRLSEDWRLGSSLEKAAPRIEERHYESNKEAIRILKECAAHGKTFALYLRSFEVELVTSVFDAQSRSPAIADSIQIIAINEFRLEEAIFRSFKDVLPFVAADNPLAWARFRNPIARFPLRNGDWQRAVETLIRHAEFVVMEISWLSPNVEYELNALRKWGREYQTVVLLQGSDFERTIEEASALTQFTGGPGKYSRKVVQQDDPRLAGFTRITRVDQVDWDSAIRHEVFQGLWQGSTARAN